MFIPGENKASCPSPFLGTNFEVKCCENVLGTRWITFRHPKKDAYNDQNAAIFSEHSIVQLTVWLMKAARWVSEGTQNNKKNKKKNKKVQNAKS